jgi:SAM-dependent methyltransferase
MTIPTTHQELEQPSEWVARFAPLIPPGEVLDLACGGGRHARLLAAAGHQVLALDRDADALARAAGPNITCMQSDLEAENAQWPFAKARFAGIVVTNYLHRPLLPHLFRSLAKPGLLIYETFADGNEKFGKPSRPDFLLRRGELLAVAAAIGAQVIAYEDGHLRSPQPAIVQRICLAMPGTAVADLRLN